MHYAPDSDTGHLTLMHRRLQRLHASMRARGASPSAIARLPKLPQYVAPLTLPPVLATAANATDYAMQARTREIMKTVPRRSGKFTPKPKREKVLAPKSRLAQGRAQHGADDAVLWDRILREVSRASGVVPYALCDETRPRHVVPARHIAWRLLREFSGLSTAAIASLVRRACHTTIGHGLWKTLDHMADPKWAAVYWAARTRVQATGRRAVEDLSEKPMKEAA